MVEESRAQADIRGHAVTIALKERVDGFYLSASRLNQSKVVRREGAYPMDLSDGRVVADFPEFFRGPDVTPRIERILCYLPQRVILKGTPEILQAEVEMRYVSSSSQHPSKVRITCRKTEMAPKISEEFEDITRVEYDVRQTEMHSVQETFFIYQAVGGREKLTARIQITATYRSNGEEISGWFKLFRCQEDVPRKTIGWSAKASATVTYDPATDSYDITINAVDLGLSGGTTYYYTIIQSFPSSPSNVGLRPIQGALPVC